MPLGEWEEAGLLGRGKIWGKNPPPSASRKGRGDGGTGRAVSLDGPSPSVPTQEVPAREQESRPWGSRPHGGCNRPSAAFL